MHPTTRSNSKHQPSPKPYSRYLSISAYRFSTIPIPSSILQYRVNSPLEFYFHTSEIEKEKTKLAFWNEILKKLVEQLQTQRIYTSDSQWQTHIINDLKQLIDPLTLSSFDIDVQQTHTQSQSNDTAPSTPRRNWPNPPDPPISSSQHFISRGHQNQRIAAQQANYEMMHRLDEEVSTLKNIFERNYEKFLSDLQISSNKLVENLDRTFDPDHNTILMKNNTFEDYDDGVPVDISNFDSELIDENLFVRYTNEI